MKHGYMSFDDAEEEGTVMDDRKMIELIIEIEPMLYRIAKQHLRSREDQEDAVQECLYKVWKNRKMLRQPQYFKTWAVRILKNECMTIGRKLERKEDRLDENASAIQVDMDKQLEYEAMYQALEEVHYENRNIIFLHFCSGYKYKEIAEMTATPLGTVVTRAHRSLKCVRRMLSA